MSRPSWDRTWFDTVAIIARRGSCPRLRTGCLLVDSRNHLLAMGYNGSPPGHPTCDQDGCFIVDEHCLRTNHAELNALLNAARTQAPVEGCTAYILHRPCLRCTNALVGAGVSRILYQHDYHSKPNDPAYKGVAEVCNRSTIPLIQWKY